LTRVLLTGATGFIGGALLARLLESGTMDVTVATRQRLDAEAKGAHLFEIESLDGAAEWAPAIAGVDVVIHAAARVHVMNDRAADPLAEFRRINVEGTLNLARQAAEAGVRRFIFISSIKVNGEANERGKPYTADGKLIPLDPYGISKFEAEQGLRSLAAETGMEVVIIRPVLVYGPGVKANFLSMVKWVSKGVPLPLGAIHNVRSLVALDNLVDLIVTCIDHPAAANQVFLVSDGEDLSTTELLRRMGRALGRPARLLPIPGGVLRFVARLIGRADIAQRLCASLQVDISKTRKLLGWSPPVGVDEALSKTARYFLEHQSK
jgi:UDP-glucose 4-epimerase